MKTRLALAFLFLVPFALRADEPAVPNLAPDAAIRNLQDGNKRFILDQSAVRPTYKALREKTAKGQKPIAAILTCADSRVGAGDGLQSADRRPLRVSRRRQRQL